MTSPPEQPTGLRVSYPDGHVDPMDCTYAGRDEAGTRVWIAYLPAVAAGHVVDILVDILPPHTQLVIMGPL